MNRIITEKEFVSIVELYEGVLVGVPTKKEALKMYYEDISSHVTAEKFSNILKYHRKRSEYFPKICEILNYLKPPLKITIENIFQNPKTEIDFKIKKWCEENFDVSMPVSDFDRQRMTIKEMDEMRKRQGWAISEARKTLNDNPHHIEFLKLDKDIKLLLEKKDETIY